MTDVAEPLTKPRLSPYVGPRSFQPGEKLYGREQETAALIDLIIAERIVLLYSPSGAGKSSLIQAALLPGLTEQSFSVLPTIRVNLEPPEALKVKGSFNRYLLSALLSLEEGRPVQCRLPMDELACMSLDAYLLRRLEEEELDSLVLVFDQFEEVLTVDPMQREAKQEFFTQVGQALRDRSRWALFAMREDFVPALDPYLRSIPTRLSNRFRLDLLEVNGALEAIQQPVRAVGLEFEEDAARKLVDDLRRVTVQQEDGTLQAVPGLYVEPVQLQVVCSKLWQDLPEGSTAITLESVEAMGDTNQALADYYNRQVLSVVEASGVSERAIRTWIDRKLITVQGIRGQVLLGAEETEGLPNKAVRLLEKAYLVRAEKRGGATWFELAHDRLIQPVRESNAAWFSAHLVPLQRQAEVWQEHGRPDGMLLTGQALEEAEVWAKEHAAELTRMEKAFLEEAVKAHEAVLKEQRYTRRIRTLAIVASIVGILALIAGVVAFGSYLEAQRQGKISRARQITFAALNNLDVDPERAMLLALAAIEEAGGPEKALPSAINALHLAFQANHIEYTLQKHTDRVYGVDYSPDGSRLASASKDGTVRVWDPSTGEELLMINHPDGAVFSDVHYSPDGKLLGSSAADASIYLWDAQTGALVARLTDGEGVMWGLAFSSDGRYVAAAHEDGIARMWSMETRQMVRTFDTGSQMTLEGVAFSPDGALLAAACDDTNAYVWDVETGDLRFTLQGHTEQVNNVEFSKSGEWITTASADRLIGVWDSQNGANVQFLQGHLDWAYRAAFIYDDEYLITSSADREIRLWELATGIEVYSYNGHANQVFDIAVHPDGYHIASSSQDQTVRIWNATTTGSRELFTLASYGDKVHSMDLMPNGKQMALALAEYGIEIWNVGEGEEPLYQIETSGRVIEDVAYSPDGKTLASVGLEGQVVLYDTQTYQPALTVDTGHALSDVVFSPDSSRFLIACGDGSVRVLDAHSGKEQQVLEHPAESKTNAALTAAFHPNANAAAAGYKDGSVIVWDLSSGAARIVLEGQHSESVQAVLFSPDGRTLATAGEDARVYLLDLDLARGQAVPQKVLETHFGGVFALDFSVDGKMLASAGADTTIRLWDVQSGAERGVLNAHWDRIQSVKFSRDGRSLISSSLDSTVRAFLLDPTELVKLARQRVTRSLTDQECQTFLNLDKCPEP